MHKKSNIWIKLEAGRTENVRYVSKECCISVVTNYSQMVQTFHLIIRVRTAGSQTAFASLTVPPSRNIFRAASIA